MRQQYSKDFKQDAVVYVQTHPELTVAQCVSNLGINDNTLHNWLKSARTIKCYLDVLKRRFYIFIIKEILCNIFWLNSF